MPDGVAGARPVKAVPYTDDAGILDNSFAFHQASVHIMCALATLTILQIQ